MEVLLGVKIGCLFALLALTLGCGLAPIYFKWFQMDAATGHHYRVLSLLGCVSAGVFLGAGLMHMTAEALGGIESEIQKFMVQNSTGSKGNSSQDAASSYVSICREKRTRAFHALLTCEEYQESLLRRWSIPMESSSSPWAFSLSSFWSRWLCSTVMGTLEDQQHRERNGEGLMPLNSTSTHLCPHPHGGPSAPSSFCSHCPFTPCSKV
ncbi:zinc transporter ZIP2 isoform X2 [Cricetulus griseus]|uniref:Zinc transporter ZIP2 isoform X2 n=1 Tax=Cricetulus griseus TaxID=10029 RepID=A0A9J7EYC9_CRIGR|nr:zinc transporter ZIP2 isoform X2 [Cricetulus griseus]XP_027242419.1 zinc transporter ZIP2 isoform X2 [Cricetulus griseus]